MGKFLILSLLPFAHSIHLNAFTIHLFIQYLLSRLVRHHERWWKIMILTLEWYFTAYMLFLHKLTHSSEALTSFHPSSSPPFNVILLLIFLIPLSNLYCAEYLLNELGVSWEGKLIGREGSRWRGRNQSDKMEDPRCFLYPTL